MFSNVHTTDSPAARLTVRTPVARTPLELLVGSTHVIAVMSNPLTAPSVMVKVPGAMLENTLVLEFVLSLSSSSVKSPVLSTVCVKTKSCGPSGIVSLIIVIVPCFWLTNLQTTSLACSIVTTTAKVLLVAITLPLPPSSVHVIETISQPPATGSVSVIV